MEHALRIANKLKGDLTESRSMSTKTTEIKPNKFSSPIAELLIETSKLSTMNTSKAILMLLMKKQLTNKRIEKNAPTGTIGNIMPKMIIPEWNIVKAFFLLEKPIMYPAIFGEIMSDMKIINELNKMFPGILSMKISWP